MPQNRFAYVTTFSEDGYAQYGKKFVQSFDQNMCDKLYLILDEPFETSHLSPNIELRDNDFIDQINNTYQSFNAPKNYRFAPNRFCYKTSAVLSAFNECRSDFDYLVWLDADSIIKRHDLTKYLENLMPDNDQIASFFDRDCSYGYCETGIVIFNMKHSGTKDFLHKWNDAFVTGEIFNYSEWHDAFYFSYLVRSHPPGLFKFLCAEFGLKTTHPIFELKPLRNRIEHLKGDARKILGFSPEKYWIPSFIFRRLTKRK